MKSRSWTVTPPQQKAGLTYNNGGRSGGESGREAGVRGAVVSPPVDELTEDGPKANAKARGSLEP